MMMHAQLQSKEKQSNVSSFPLHKTVEVHEGEKRKP